ncbi:MAG: PCRF domain-containing protein, partial [Mobilicoccus sp.]|nr:PCRF domain-containing protein [Mobilicoccus sp.]
MATDFAQELKDLKATMASVREVSDLDALRAQIADLEQKSAAPDLWDDPDSAQKVTSALSRANAELDRITGMDARIEDLEVLVEMGIEEGGAEGDAALAEAERELVSLRKAVGELEVKTMLSGEYDPREAVITIRAGAGGVDAADFAEMLLRM